MVAANAVHTARRCNADTMLLQVEFLEGLVGRLSHELALLQQATPLSPQRRAALVAGKLVGAVLPAKGMFDS